MAQYKGDVKRRPPADSRGEFSASRDVPPAQTTRRCRTSSP